jgi:hypothetical protein
MRNKVTLYRNSTYHLSALLHSPIFASKNTKLKELYIKKNVLSTQNERVVYSGLALDTGRDFELFSAIMTKFYNNNKYNELENINRAVVLTQSEIYEILDIRNNNKNTNTFGGLQKRLENIEQARLTVYKYEDSRHIFDDSKAQKRINFPLLKKTEFDSRTKRFVIHLSEEIESLSYQSYSKQYINMSEYEKLKNQQSKAIYLFLSTKIFKNSKNVVLNIDLDVIRERMTHAEKMENKEKNRALKAALIDNQRQKLFKKFEILTKKGKVKIVLNSPKVDEISLPF